MKTSFVLLFSTCLSLLAWSQKIEFRSLSFAEAQAAAKAENKVIFIDAYAEWCGPCKWMTANIFTQAEVANYYNQNFINLKVDMEKGEGKELAKRYGVQAYPTLLWLNAEGQVLFKAVGASQEAQVYIDRGEQARDPKGNLLYLQENLAQEAQNPVFMGRYFKAKAAANDLDEAEVDAFFSQFPVAKWASDSLFDLLKVSVTSSESESFREALGEQALFYKKQGKEAQSFFENAFFNQLATQRYRVRKEADRQAWLKKTQKELKALSGSEALMFRLSLLDAQLSKDWLAYAKIAQTGAKDFLWDDAMKLNEIAWNVYSQVEDEALLQAALSWAERAIALDRQHMILDTYAHLLNALGNPEKALKIELEALEQAQAQGADTGDYQAFINKLQ